MRMAPVPGAEQTWFFALRMGTGSTGEPSSRGQCQLPEGDVAHVMLLTQQRGQTNGEHSAVKALRVVPFLPNHSLNTSPWNIWISGCLLLLPLNACMVVRIPPEEIVFLFWIFLLHLSPPLSCQSCCFCFLSHHRSEVINYLKGRKHLGVLCYVNNKRSCPQALVQVVNKLVNYIEINAIASDLKLRSPCIGSVLPVPPTPRVPPKGRGTGIWGNLRSEDDARRVWQPWSEQVPVALGSRRWPAHPNGSGMEGFLTRSWHVKRSSVLVASPTFD